MHVLIVILEMGLMITALLAAAGVAFYALVWVSLLVASSFPIIGKRHRHEGWDDLNKPSERASTAHTERAGGHGSRWPR